MQLFIMQRIKRSKNLIAYNLVKELPIEDMMAYSNYLRIDQNIF